MIGQKYNRLIAIKRTGAVGNGRQRKALWLFRCDCGNLVSKRACDVRSGNTKSCGCLHIETAIAKIYGRGTTHGKSGTPEYIAWSDMLKRCDNPNAPNYPRYGGRGIKVSRRWRTFANFYADMGDRPSPSHSIDRIDNNGNYSKQNCRWATQEEQRKNRRTTIFVQINGKTMPLAEAARLTKTNYNVAYARLRHGWPIDRALGLT